MAYIGVSPVDVQTTVISGAQNTATLPLAQPTAVSFISGAFLQYANDRYLEGLPDVGGLETQQDYNVWVFEAFNSQHSLVDTTEPNAPVDGELYYDTTTEALKIYSAPAGQFLNTQKGPLDLIDDKIADLSGIVDTNVASASGLLMPLAGGSISASASLNAPRTDGLVQLIQDEAGDGGKLEIKSNDAGTLATTMKLYPGGGIEMAGILSLNGTGNSATIRAYGASGVTKQLNLATGNNSDTTGVSTRMRLSSDGVTIFSSDLILDTTGAGTAGIQAKGSSGQDVWSLSSDGQFNTPNLTPLKFNTNNGTSEIVAYNGSNAGLNLSVNTSAVGTGTSTPIVSFDRTQLTLNSAYSNNWNKLQLNGPGIHWYQGAGSHYLYIEATKGTGTTTSQSYSIIFKDVQNQSATDTLYVLSSTSTATHANFYTDYVAFPSPCRGIEFTNGNAANALTFTSLQPFTIGAGGVDPASFDNIIPYLKFQSNIVSVGTSTQRIDTQTHGFVTLNSPIAANQSGNWFNLTGTAGGVENSTVLRVKQNSGSDTNIEYFGSTSGGNSLQTKSSLVGNIQTSKITFYDTINYYDTIPITFFPNTTTGQQYILIGGNDNQTLTFKHTRSSQSTSAAGNNMFSINSEGVQVSTGNLNFNGTSGSGQFIKFGTTPTKSFYIAREDSSGNLYTGFAMNPANANSGNFVYFPQRTFFGLTGNQILDAKANKLTTQPMVNIQGLGTDQNLVTFEANSTSTARNQYIMFGGSGDSSQFGTYQIARGTRTTNPPNVSTDVFIRFRCPNSGTIQTDFLAPVNMPNSVSAENPHTRGEFDTVMTALKAAVNSSTDHATLKAALLSALAAY